MNMLSLFPGRTEVSFDCGCNFCAFVVKKGGTNIHGNKIIYLLATEISV